MSGRRRPFLNVHRLSVLAPVWLFGVPIAVGALTVTIADYFGYQALPLPALIFLFVVLAMVGIWSSLCPRCDAWIISHNGEFWWGLTCTFFAHEECPKCGLDLCAVTPWRTGIIRQRKDWIAALPQPRKFWIQMGSSRIILTRLAVLYLLFWGLPAVWRGVRAGWDTFGF